MSCLQQLQPHLAGSNVVSVAEHVVMMILSLVSLNAEPPGASRLGQSR